MKDCTSTNAVIKLWISTKFLTDIKVIMAAKLNSMELATFTLSIQLKSKGLLKELSIIN
jgi:hypothetical protein